MWTGYLLDTNRSVVAHMEETNEIHGELKFVITARALATEFHYSRGDRGSTLHIHVHLDYPPGDRYVTSLTALEHSGTNPCQYDDEVAMPLGRGETTLRPLVPQDYIQRSNDMLREFHNAVESAIEQAVVNLPPEASVRAQFWIQLPAVVVPFEVEIKAAEFGE